jgi:hypothetical protein
MNDKTTYLVTGDEPIKVTYSDQAAEFIDSNKPKRPRMLDRQLPTSKHASGRVKPLSKGRKRRLDNKDKRAFQARLSMAVDERALRNG